MSTKKVSLPPMVLTEPCLGTPGPRARDPAPSPRSQQQQRGAKGGTAAEGTAQAHLMAGLSTEGAWHLGSPFARTECSFKVCPPRQGLRCSSAAPGFIHSADAPWSAASVAQGVFLLQAIRTSGCVSILPSCNGARFDHHPQADARAGAPHGARREGGDSAEGKGARMQEAKPQCSQGFGSSSFLML